MFKNQRHQEILEILEKERFATVQSLSERLYASLPTIRRDLNALEKQGLVRRSHGGAVLSDGRSGLPVFFRSGKNASEKLRLCRVAARLVSPDSLIFTDASSTTQHLAATLNGDDRITVVTGGYPACKLFSDKGFRVFSTGGRLLPDTQAFVGEAACESVGRYRADVMFFSSSSLSADGVISDWSEEETALRRAMLRQADTRVFLCDGAKLDSRSAFCLCSLSDVEYAVTGLPLSEDILSACGLCLLSEEEAFLYGKRKA